MSAALGIPSGLGHSGTAAGSWQYRRTCAQNIRIIHNLLAVNCGVNTRCQYQVLNYDDHWSRTPLQQSANIVRHRNAVLWSVMQMCNSHETIKPPCTCSGALATAAAKLAKWRVSTVADCSTTDSTSAGSSSIDSSPSAACRAVYSCSSLHKRTRPVSGQQLCFHVFSWLQAGRSMSQGPTSASGHHLPRRRLRLPPPAPPLSPTPDRAAAPAALDTPNEHAYEPTEPVIWY